MEFLHKMLVGDLSFLGYKQYIFWKKINLFIKINELDIAAQFADYFVAHMRDYLSELTNNQLSIMIFQLQASYTYAFYLRNNSIYIYIYI